MVLISVQYQAIVLSCRPVALIQIESDKTTSIYNVSTRVLR